nr:transmembrane and coiled-coil domain-containing protein 4-like [Tanacetum cinerariifolium]
MVCICHYECLFPLLVTSHALLLMLSRPLFLDIDSSAWSGLEETAGGSCPSQHIGARYASAALFGLALNQAQIHQTLLLGSAYDEVTSDRASNASSSNSSADSVADDPLLWVHDSSGLLRPVFRSDEMIWND